MATALRPLTLGELLDRTFLLYRRYFLVFVGIAALPNLLLLAAQLTSLVLGIQGQFSITMVLVTFGLLFLALFVSAMAQAATVVAVSRLHLERPATIADAFASLRGRIFAILMIMIVEGLVVGVGLLFLIIPGVIFFLRLALVVPVAVLERKNLGDTFSRSWALTKGSMLRVFVIYVLYFILVIVISGVSQTPLLIAAFTAAQTGVDELPMWANILSQVANFVSQSLVTPLLTIAISLLYYDERVRKEAFDLEHMMSQLDAAAAGRPVTA